MDNQVKLAQEIKERNISGIRQTKGEKIFTVVNYLFFALLSIIMIYPFWHILMYSFSNVQEAMTGGIFLYPRGFNVDTYKSVFANKAVWSGFGISIFTTVIGTTLGTFITALTAYPLSKSRLRGGKVIMFLIFFTMLFSGGMIPSYLLIKGLGLLDNVWALILPLLVSAYNVIIMKNFFMGIPTSLEESAKIDGASDLVIFFRIILPISKAVIATIALFTAVMYWNDFFSTILYINTKTKWSLQAVLRDLLTNTQEAMRNAGIDVRHESNMTAETIKCATVIVSTIPILVIYPFLQKYFVKGVMIGSIKG